MARVLNLGGRYFTPTEQTTARQDGWVMVQMAESGLDAFAGQPLNGETSRAVVLQALRSGRTWHLLAGFLVESGQAWTPASAAANAAFFAELTAAEDKQLMDDAFVGLLAGFFLNAPGSSTPSLSASAPTTMTTTSPTAPNADARSIDASDQAPVATGERAPGS